MRGKKRKKIKGQKVGGIINCGDKLLVERVA